MDEMPFVNNGHTIFIKLDEHDEPEDIELLVKSAFMNLVWEDAVARRN